MIKIETIVTQDKDGVIRVEQKYAPVEMNTPTAFKGSRYHIGDKLKRREHYKSGIQQIWEVEGFTMGADPEEYCIKRTYASSGTQKMILTEKEIDLLFTLHI